MTKNISSVLYRIGDELVISVENSSVLHARVYDLNGSRIGKVMRVLGPVESPYGVVKISGNRDGASEEITAIEIRSGKND